MGTSESVARVKRDQYHYTVGADIEPVVEVAPGDEVVVETVDCFSNKITDKSQRFNSVAELLKVVPGLNPVSGPVAVAGAEPGDIIAVHVLDIKVGTAAPQAVTMVVPDFGGLCNPHTLVDELGPDTKICPIGDDAIDLPLPGRTVKLPIRPMIGTIWSAPAVETRYSFVYDVHNCGNIDCPDLGPASTVLLPVTTPGALVSLGDVHACMGGSEITGMAMETSADVHLRFELIKAADSTYLNCPQIESERTVGSVGCDFGRPLGDNVKSAFRDMALRLHRHHGFSRVEAYQLPGQLAEVVVHQTVGDFNSVPVKLDRKYLA